MICAHCGYAPLDEWRRIIRNVASGNDGVRIDIWRHRRCRELAYRESPDSNIPTERPILITTTT